MHTARPSNTQPLAGTRWTVIHADGLLKALAPAAPEMVVRAPDGRTRDVGVLAYLAGRLLPCLKACLPGATHLATVTTDGDHPARLAARGGGVREASGEVARAIAARGDERAFWTALNGATLDLPASRAPDLAATLHAMGAAVSLVSRDRSARILAMRGVRVFDPTSRTGANEVPRAAAILRHEADTMALAGHRPAGVAGSPGIGAVRAEALLTEHGSLDAVEAAWAATGSARAGTGTRARAALCPRVDPVLPFDPRDAEWDREAARAVVDLLEGADLGRTALGYRRLLVGCQVPSESPAGGGAVPSSVSLGPAA